MKKKLQDLEKSDIRGMPCEAVGCDTPIYRPGAAVIVEDPCRDTYSVYHAKCYFRLYIQKKI